MSSRPRLFAPFFGGSHRLAVLAALIAGAAGITGAARPAAANEIGGFEFATGPFLPFQRTVLHVKAMKNPPTDPTGVWAVELEQAFDQNILIDRVSAPFGTTQITLEESTTIVRWSGRLCGPQSTCPETASVEILIELFPEFSAQGRGHFLAANYRATREGTPPRQEFGALSPFSMFVDLLPPFSTAPMLQGSGAVTLAKFCGVGSFERMGGVLASGDFDSDGFDDLAIGLPRRSVGSVAAAGAVCVLHGGVDPFSATTVRAKLLRHGLPGVFGAAQTSSGFGETLATGDFDGDGFTDLAVGASFYDVGTAVDDGAVWVFRGSPQGLRTEDSRFLDQTGSPSESDRGQDRFGFSLAAGDIDADGLDDLIVGAPFEDVRSGMTSIVDGGIVQILHSFGTGNPLSKRFSVVGAGARFLDGRLLRTETVEANDRYGWRVAAGDLEGSAADEWVVSSPFETVGSVAAGVVEVYRFDAGGGGGVVVQSDSPCDRVFCYNGMRFGETLHVADVNGDSRPDLLVADRATVSGAASAGSVTVYPDVPWSYGFAFEPFVLHQSAPSPSPNAPNASDLFGFSLATGDFNGDGLNDLAAGVPAENTGQTSNTGFVDIFYTPWRSEEMILGRQGFDQSALGEAREAADEFGAALASGDFNGDGFDDLAIGVPGEEIGGGATDMGVVQVIFGGGGN